MSPVIWSKSDGGNGHAYQIVAVSWGFTWEEAKKAAEASGGHLVTINSKAENDFVYGLINKNAGLWAVDKSGNGYGPWIGGYKKEGVKKAKEGWKWVTGEEVKYSSWASGEPNNYKNKENAICFYRVSMTDKPTWNDVEQGIVLPACIVEFDNPK